MISLPTSILSNKVFDNMPLPHFDSATRKRARVEMPEGAARPQCDNTEARGSARASGVAERNPLRYGGSRSA